MTKREELEAVEPERVDEARFPRLAASVRALARLAIAEAKKAGSAGKQMITKNQIQARLAGQATIERKRIEELRARLRGPLTAQERDRTAQELTRLEGQLVVKSLNGVSYLRRARPRTRGDRPPTQYGFGPDRAAPRPGIMNDNILYHT